MILVDSALARHVAEGKPPIRVGMIGAGFMASGVLLQINSVHRDTMRVVAIANRTPAKAVAGLCRRRPGGRGGLRQRRRRSPAPSRPGAPRSPRTRCWWRPSPHVDVLLEVTGAVEDAIAPVLAAHRARQARAR